MPPVLTLPQPLTVTLAMDQPTTVIDDEEDPDDDIVLEYGYADSDITSE